MANVWDRIVGLFKSASPGTEPLKDRATMEALWCNRAPKAKRRLGTIAEAKRTIEAVTERGSNCRGLLQVLDDYCRRENERRRDSHPPQPLLGEDDQVGDPSDVHHIIPPKHVIGYAVEECEDGFALETIEALHVRWTVLRLRDKIIGADSVGVMRHESYGPMRVV